MVVATGGNLGFQLGQQRLRVPPPPVSGVGPDALELRGFGIEPPKRATGDELPVVQADEHRPAGRRELLCRIGAQPLRHRCDRGAISTGVLESQFRQQRFGQRVILVDRDEAQLVHRGYGHHLTV